MRWFKYKARHLHRTKQPIFGAWIPSQVKQHAQQQFQRLCCRLPPRTSRGPRTLQLICPSRWEIAPWVVAWGCQVCAWPPWTGNMSWPVWPLAAVPTTSMPSWECGAMRPPSPAPFFAWEIVKDPGWSATPMVRTKDSMIPSRAWLTCEISSLTRMIHKHGEQLDYTWASFVLRAPAWISTRSWRWASPSTSAIPESTSCCPSVQTPLNLFGGLIWFNSFLSYVWSVLPSWFWHTSVSCWMAQAGRSISQHWMEYFRVKTI